MPYEVRLRQFDLTTIEHRRDRGDLIQIYKIINGLEEVHLKKDLNFAVSDHFERGNYKILRRQLDKILRREDRSYSITFSKK